MNHPRSIVSAVRFAVETAQVVLGDGAASAHDVAVTTEARGRLQQVIDTAGKLALAEQACWEEMMSQIRLQHMETAVAALWLKEHLGEVTFRRRLFEMRPDGTFVLIDDSGGPSRRP